jgi:pyruvate formate-lyase activating enzyme-like uncharacterized protein
MSTPKGIWERQRVTHFLTMRGDGMRRSLLVSAFAIMGLLTRAHAADAIFAAYCVGYYKYTVQEMQRSLNLSRQWAKGYADQPADERQAWQKVIDTNERELQREMLELDRLEKYLAQSHVTDDLNNVSLAILMAELRGQDDLRACFNEAAPAHEVPPSCERVRRCRHTNNAPF